MLIPDGERIGKQSCESGPIRVRRALGLHPMPLRLGKYNL